MADFLRPKVRAGIVLATLISMAATVAPAGAQSLLAHRASYNLTLDGSKASGRLEQVTGQIDYEIRGDVCEGYTTLTRQMNESDTGDGDPQKVEMVSTAWEGGKAEAYRFRTTSTKAGDTTSELEASVTREGTDALKVVVTKPSAETVTLKGEILLPTEHVVKVLQAGAAGETVLEAKVFDGASDAAKVFNTLAVIGKASTDDARLSQAGKEALKGRTYYPVTISYYDEGSGDRTPAYVMTISLYDNGVVGDLKIDYGAFALRGGMTSFEALKASEACRP